jgi:hypothetical protein
MNAPDSDTESLWLTYVALIFIASTFGRRASLAQLDKFRLGVFMSNIITIGVLRGLVVLGNC